MPRSLEDARIKFTILTEEPENPAAPTVDELNATSAIQAQCNFLASDFTWSATDSDKIQQKDMCTEGNANALGPSNYQGGFTVFREYDLTTKAPLTTGDDKVFNVMRKKGTELWGYARISPKKATDAWAADDEIYLGGRFITDEPQRPSDGGGYIRFRVPVEIQDGWSDIKVVAAGA